MNISYILWQPSCGIFMWFNLVLYSLSSNKSKNSRALKSPIYLWASMGPRKRGFYGLFRIPDSPLHNTDRGTSLHTSHIGHWVEHFSCACLLDNFREQNFFNWSKLFAFISDDRFQYFMLWLIIGNSVVMGLQSGTILGGMSSSFASRNKSIFACSPWWKLWKLAGNPSSGRYSLFWSRNKHSIEEVAVRRLPKQFEKKLIYSFCTVMREVKEWFLNHSPMLDMITVVNNRDIPSHHPPLAFIQEIL
jgi:hypothetical protein